MLEEIIQRNLSRIALDLEEIPGIISIDFMDIFPVSEDHRSQLDAEVARRARALQNTERGNVYELDEPIQTQYGELKSSLRRMIPWCIFWNRWRRKFTPSRNYFYFLPPLR